MAEKRLIDLNALGIGERNPNAFNNPERAYGWNDLLKILETAPTVDAVEVVRCKDCKHWCQDFSSYLGDDESSCTNPDGLDNYAHPDDFCSYGERKEK